MADKFDWDEFPQAPLPSDTDPVTGRSPAAASAAAPSNFNWEDHPQEHEAIAAMEKNPAVADYLRAVAASGGQGLTSGWADELLTAPADTAMALLGRNPRHISEPLAPEDKDKSTKELYQKYLSQARQENKDLQKEYPATSTVSELGGALASPINKPLAALAGVGKGTALLDRLIASGALGTAQGALYGAGQAEDNKLEGAVKGGELGAALGTAIPLAGAGASKALEKTGLTDTEMYKKFIKNYERGLSGVKTYGTEAQNSSAADLKASSKELGNVQKEALHLLDNEIDNATKLSTSKIDNKDALVATFDKIKAYEDQLVGDKLLTADKQKEINDIKNTLLDRIQGAPVEGVGTKKTYFEPKIEELPGTPAIPAVPSGEEQMNQLLQEAQKKSARLGEPANYKVVPQDDNLFLQKILKQPEGAGESISEIAQKKNIPGIPEVPATPATTQITPTNVSNEIERPFTDVTKVTPAQHKELMNDISNTIDDLYTSASSGRTRNAPNEIIEPLIELQGKLEQAQLTGDLAPYNDALKQYSALKRASSQFLGQQKGSLISKPYLQDTLEKNTYKDLQKLQEPGLGQINADEKFAKLEQAIPPSLKGKFQDILNRGKYNAETESLVAGNKVGLGELASLKPVAAASGVSANLIGRGESGLQEALTKGGDDVLMQAANKLRTSMPDNELAKSVSAALEDSIKTKDHFKRNAAVFTILQNPSLKQTLAPQSEQP